MIHIQSVIIYLAVFSVSIFLLYFSQCILYKYRKVKGINNYNRRILGYFCLGLSITIPCLLAALRSMNVGDDVDAYIEPNFIFSSGLTDNGFIVSIRPRACFSPSYNKVKSQTKHVWLLTLL